MSFPTKFIFVTGGVLSSLGKGIAAAAMGALLESRGLSVSFQKLDPYFNIDPGTMNPTQHGEVYVTDDGAETDMDLGHYERFTSCRTGKSSNFTSGKIYHSVLSRERRGEYLGATVQVIPHITDEIKSCIRAASMGCDILIVEIGGTVGDIESLPFLEAIRQFKVEAGRDNVLFVHLTYVPFLKTSGEVKTKPTQHSVKELRSIGIQPDILLCRTSRYLSKEIKAKIALFCDVDAGAVITAKDVKYIYEVPLVFRREGLDDKIVEHLRIWSRKPRLGDWEDLARRFRAPVSRTVRVALVGKYTNETESYKSLVEALRHAALANRCGLDIVYVDSESLSGSTESDPAQAAVRNSPAHSAGKGEGAAGPDETPDNSEPMPLDLLASAHGILVPGGFGNRGIEGKILAAGFARTRGIPYFGICLGMQVAVIEFARAVAGLAGANSAEFDSGTGHPVIHMMRQWYDHRAKAMQDRSEEGDKGGTMRLGAYPCEVRKKTLAQRAYGEPRISERHRHRYEFNNDYTEILEGAGMVVSGASPRADLVEIVEIRDHPWFLGCQFHPEFLSKPLAPHPLFRDFISACICESRRRAGEPEGDCDTVSDPLPSAVAGCETSEKGCMPEDAAEARGCPPGDAAGAKGCPPEDADRAS